MRVVWQAKMLKETETEETIGFFVTFLSFAAFQLGGPSGSAYVNALFCDIDGAVLPGRNDAEMGPANSLHASA